MKDPVSVVVCIHNRADLLRRTLDTFCVQEFPDWELILVDDRSTDGLGDVLDTFSSRIPRITWIKVDKTIAPIPLGPGTSQGIGTSMNIGHRHASYETILRCDPETLQLTRTLWEASELDVSNTAWYVPIFDVGIDHANQIKERWEEFRVAPASIPGALFPSEKPLKSWWYMQAVWGRTPYLSIGGVDEHFTRGAACEDDDFVYRWRKKGYKTRWPNDMLALHMYHGGRIWHSTPEHVANFEYLRGWENRPVEANQGLNSDSCILEILEIKDMKRKSSSSKPKKPYLNWKDKVADVDTYASMPLEDSQAYYDLCARKDGGEFPVLEIGVYKGHSTIIGLCGALNAGIESGVVVVDPFNHDGLNPIPDVDFEDEFRANIARAGFIDHLTVHKGRFQDVGVDAEPFRLILIDGDHSRTAEDYEQAKDLLAPNGILAIHDWRWGHRNIDELCDRLERKTKAHGNSPHLWWGQF